MYFSYIEVKVDTSYLKTKRCEDSNIAGNKSIFVLNEVRNVFLNLCSFYTIFS